ncbi:MAG: M28 family peptidase [Bacteroidales bacterium]|nr:M28 family peptidase [Bacteroidales bacterium]MCF8405139.1 M28 family peptidase [Bacteroidales bacterium]
MKKVYLLLILCFFLLMDGIPQYNMQLTNPEAESIIFSNYDPGAYLPSTIINHPDSILYGIINDISKDTLQAYLEKIDSFYNRNSGSDTVSNSHGIGAVRRWIYSKLEEISSSNENRLIVSYLTFEQNICGQNFHKNVLGVLPGKDTTNKEMLIIEGHFDTRCEGVCDTACYSPGMEDNGSGTVLVMELARIMSRYTFDHTIVFTLTTGEDQGLYGAKAFANYLWTNDLDVKACLNNDVIGGIICGNTSSPPSCPGLNHIDSTHVRIFSYSGWDDSTKNSPHKQLARYIKMQQIQRINPLLETPMDINLILWEDRTGRSGDHIPFRQRGYTSVRFCSQNEHGNGTGTPPDRQHTTNDILGVDTDIPPDGIIDSFYVDMGYLRRNAITNGVNIGLLANSPPKPIPVFNPVASGINIEITGSDTVYQSYRVGIRSEGSGTLYFDSVYAFDNTSNFTIFNLIEDKEYYVSVCNVDNGVEGLFSDEFTTLVVGLREQHSISHGIYFLPVQPNPSKNCCKFEILSQNPKLVTTATIVICDITGNEMEQISTELTPGKTRILYENQSRLKGLYFCSLIVNAEIIQTRKVVFQ